MEIYNDFIVCYETGMTMLEIAKRNGVSERTIYRYKEEYEKMKGRRVEAFCVFIKMVVSVRIGFIVNIKRRFVCGKKKQEGNYMKEEKKEGITVIDVTEEYMKDRLYEFRGRKVMLDTDLAEIYG